jgi:sporulation protein YlmC with PRC-barrel domain
MEMEKVNMAYKINTRSTLLPFMLGAALIAGGASIAVAQTTSPAVMAPAAKANGSLQMSHDAWRSTKLDGATVYNEQGNDIGTINDMLLDSQGKVSNVVLSVGGYLGIDSRYVEVPFSNLKFEPSKGNGAAAGAAMSNHDYSVVLPGVTKEALSKMTAFTY